MEADSSEVALWAPGLANWWSQSIAYECYLPELIFSKDAKI